MVACILADMFIVSVVHVCTHSIGAGAPHRCMPWPSPPVHAAAATCEFKSHAIIARQGGGEPGNEANDNIQLRNLCTE